MMKRLMLMIALLVLTTSAAQATILPATGVDEDFAAWSGDPECLPSAVQFQLSVRRGKTPGRGVVTVFREISGGNQIGNKMFCGAEHLSFSACPSGSDVNQSRAGSFRGLSGDQADAGKQSEIAE